MTSSNDPLAFMPGLDFMRQFARAAADKDAAPGTGWITPTVNVKDIDKRIADLKAVLFWLEQNAHILRATVQALEVQKMTLAALQGMNVNLADIARAFAAPTDQALPESAAQTTDGITQAADPAKPASSAAVHKKKPSPAAADPLQWWDALTQQFQSIAASTLQEATPPDTTRPAPADRQVRKPAKPAAKRAAPKKSAARTGGA